MGGQHIEQKGAKTDNPGTIRIRISRADGYRVTMDSQSFDLYLNINTRQHTYHATVEAERRMPRKREVTTVEVASDVLEELAQMAQSKEFLSLNNDVIFPNIAVNDGRHVRISVETEAGEVSLYNNLLESTLLNGFIPVGDFGIQTPIDKLAAIAFNLLGIEPEEEEEE